MVCDPITVAAWMAVASGATVWATGDSGGAPPEQVPEPKLDQYSKGELEQALQQVDPDELPDWVVFDEIEVDNDYSQPDFTSRGSTHVDLDEMSFDEFDNVAERQLMDRRHCDNRDTNASSMPSDEEPSFKELVDKFR